jgi:hypothetical protein
MAEAVAVNLNFIACPIGGGSKRPTPIAKPRCTQLSDSHSRITAIASKLR